MSIGEFERQRLQIMGKMSNLRVCYCLSAKIVIIEADGCFSSWLKAWKGQGTKRKTKLVPKS